MQTNFKEALYKEPNDVSKYNLLGSNQDLLDYNGFSYIGGICEDDSSEDYNFINSFDKYGCLTGITDSNNYGFLIPSANIFHNQSNLNSDKLISNPHSNFKDTNSINDVDLSSPCSSSFDSLLNSETNETIFFDNLLNFEDSDINSPIQNKTDNYFLDLEDISDINSNFYFPNENNLINTLLEKNEIENYNEDKTLYTENNPIISDKYVINNNILTNAQHFNHDKKIVKLKQVIPIFSESVINMPKVNQLTNRFNVNNLDNNSNNKLISTLDKISNTSIINSNFLIKKLQQNNDSDNCEQLKISKEGDCLQVNKNKRKREQNKMAASKYRQKLQKVKGSVVQEYEYEENKNRELKVKISDTEKEINYLKNLLKEIEILSA